MGGQDAVNIAQGFHESCKLSGLILTKLDSDARGGAALSVRAVTGAPILFAATGEKLEAFEVFHPDRLASRILGMGDVLTLIEKAQQADDDKAKELDASSRRITGSPTSPSAWTLRKMPGRWAMSGDVPG